MTIPFARSTRASAPAHGSPARGGDEVYVWSARLDRGEYAVSQLATVLSSDERERAARYRSERDGNRFVVRRAELRLGLGRRLGVAPRQLRFGYGANGKPHLLEPRPARELRFSLSHSDGFAVYACVPGRAIAVDVERLRDQPDLAAVASRFFAPREVAKLLELPRAQQTAAFYRCWTRKEAYVKAIGAGLCAPLQAFEVAFAEHESPALVHVAWDRREPARWLMDALEVPPTFTGAILVEARDRQCSGMGAVAV